MSRVQKVYLLLVPLPGGENYTQVRKILISPLGFRIQLKQRVRFFSVADPGFPVGVRRPCRRGEDSQGSYVLKILYVEMKESGPLGDRVPGVAGKQYLCKLVS